MEEEPSAKRLRRNQDQSELVPIPFQETTKNESPLGSFAPLDLQQGIDEENYDLILNLDSELKELKEAEG